MGKEDESSIEQATLEKPLPEGPSSEAELKKFYKDKYKQTYLEERKKFLEQKAIDKAKKDATRKPLDFIKEMFFFWRKE